MSSSFWITLVICAGSLIYACFEHVEIRGEFKNSTARWEKWKNGLKLFLLWFVPAASLIGTLVGAWEGNKSEERNERSELSIRDLSNSVISFSNGMHSATQQVAVISKMTSVLQSTNKQFEIAIRGLIHHYDQSTNALAEANARLQAIRPLKERLIECLDWINPGIVSTLRSEGIRSSKLRITQDAYNRLSALMFEPGASKYASIIRDETPALVYVTEIGNTKIIVLTLNPELLK